MARTSLCGRDGSASRSSSFTPTRFVSSPANPDSIGLPRPVLNSGITRGADFVLLGNRQIALLPMNPEQTTMSANSTLTPGTNCVVRWEANPKSSTPIKSNHVNGQRTKKIVLPELTGRGQVPKAGESWVCRVERETNTKSENRGAIIVKPLAIEIDPSFPGVWVDPIKAKLMATVLQNRENNLMLVGDQGIGKSTLSRAVATKLGWKFRKVSGGLIKKFAYMLGRYQPAPSGGQMSFKWTDSQLVKYIREAMRNPNDV